MLVTGISYTTFSYKPLSPIRSLREVPRLCRSNGDKGRVAGGYQHHTNNFMSIASSFPLISCHHLNHPFISLPKSCCAATHDLALANEFCIELGTIKRKKDVEIYAWQ